MHTTTVRFDDETWDRLDLVAEKMETAKADFIRIATIQRLERMTYEPRLMAVERRLETIERALDSLLRRLRRRRPSA